jgi:hypothetical protein
MEQEDRLRDQGFNKPFDSCPIETPSMWEYRGLKNTSGYVYCRIWRHKADNKEVLYNMLDGRVVVIGAKYHQEKEQYVGDEGAVIDELSVENETYTDSDLQDLALQLMEDNQ